MERIMKKKLLLGIVALSLAFSHSAHCSSRSQSDDEDGHRFPTYQKLGEIISSKPSSQHNSTSEHESSLEEDQNQQMEKRKQEVKQSIHSLLSLKFSHFSEDLAEKITTQIANHSVSGKEIREYFQENQTIEKHSPSTVTLFLPVKAEPINDQLVLNSLIAAAYYPKDLDPQEKQLFEVENLAHVQKQLVYSFNYNHPLAGLMLSSIADMNHLPQVNDQDSEQRHPLYELIKNQVPLKQDDYAVYRLDMGSSAEGTYISPEKQYIKIDVLDESAVWYHFVDLANLIKRD